MDYIGLMNAEIQEKLEEGAEVQAEVDLREEGKKIILNRRRRFTSANKSE